ncbi:TlpA family protein disulfide reductase [Candidatus Woesearchaeota archaeon]|nr:TlpA family protein disulfide reductase [Candidatus Woesearchaeota archaeon]
MKYLAAAEVVIFTILIFVAVGCTTIPQQENTQLAKDATAATNNEEAATSAEQQAEQSQQQQTSSGKTETSAAAAPAEKVPTKPIAKNFYEFDKAAYDGALKEGKYVFLDFYANWCPICKAEAPAIKAAFDELDADNVVGFQVNYNDDQTDADEKALAKKFGITYQHTKIFITADEKVVSRTLVAQTKQEVLKQIKDSLAAEATK